jgi:hypothetical protein
LSLLCFSKTNEGNEQPATAWRADPCCIAETKLALSTLVNQSQRQHIPRICSWKERRM